MTQTTWLKSGLALLALAGVGLLYQLIVPRFQALPVYMALPRVTLVDQNGQTFHFDQARGKVVLLSPIYTHCADICPITTAKMKQIQDRLRAAGLSSQVELVSFTVDPERDQPAVLKHFAASYNFDPANWVFLTGTPDQIQALVKTLGMYVERVYYVDNTPVPAGELPNPGANTPYEVNHTDRLFLIDRQGNVRAFPPGSRADINNVVQQIQQLVSSQAGGK